MRKITDRECRASQYSDRTAFPASASPRSVILSGDLPQSTLSGLHEGYLKTQQGTITEAMKIYGNSSDYGNSKDGGMPFKYLGGPLIWAVC